MAWVEANTCEDNYFEYENLMRLFEDSWFGCPRQLSTMTNTASPGLTPLLETPAASPRYMASFSPPFRGVFESTSFTFFSPDETSATPTPAFPDFMLQDEDSSLKNRIQEAGHLRRCSQGALHKHLTSSVRPLTLATTQPSPVQTEHAVTHAFHEEENEGHAPTSQPMDIINSVPALAGNTTLAFNKRPNAAAGFQSKSGRSDLDSLEKAFLLSTDTPPYEQLLSSSRLENSSKPSHSPTSSRPAFVLTSAFKPSLIPAKLPDQATGRSKDHLLPHQHVLVQPVTGPAAGAGGSLWTGKAQTAAGGVVVVHTNTGPPQTWADIQDKAVDVEELSVEEDAAAHRGMTSLVCPVIREHQQPTSSANSASVSTPSPVPLPPPSNAMTEAKSTNWLLGLCVPDVLPLHHFINSAKNTVFRVLLARLSESPSFCLQQDTKSPCCQSSAVLNADDVDVDPEKKVKLKVQSKLVMRASKLDASLSQLVSELEAEVCKAALMNRINTNSCMVEVMAAGQVELAAGDGEVMLLSLNDSESCPMIWSRVHSKDRINGPETHLDVLHIMEGLLLRAVPGRSVHLVQQRAESPGNHLTSQQ
ncbi:hypothetical protein CEUSTIGMA_g10101.t1 [Chlamydomonas eustigma]|uniref:Uncharacterized protein n=1 Tax=Chlamydomonas eustigma TaxID=1157962 RepID=A0A250XHW2_9CHLO|nr:hypothetical protein CEUSTIGMA_g10101.t1 [Chlamydomonas eustigma]|eukprot:GAX82675.1 hypothetical protein CEUSTIGMA_g10101.t1 [Chlamydomonas eustigma]